MEWIVEHSPKILSSEEKATTNSHETDFVLRSKFLEFNILSDVQVHLRVIVWRRNFIVKEFYLKAVPLRTIGLSFLTVALMHG